MSGIGNHCKKILVGDMNARMHGRYAHESNQLGPYVFGLGTNYMDQRRKEGIIFNKDLLLQVATANGMELANTRFQKPDKKLISHRNIGVGHRPPWTPVRYGTTDHFLINRRWKT